MQRAAMCVYAAPLVSAAMYVYAAPLVGSRRHVRKTAPLV